MASLYHLSRERDALLLSLFDECKLATMHLLLYFSQYQLVEYISYPILISYWSQFTVLFPDENEIKFKHLSDFCNSLRLINQGFIRIFQQR